MKRLHAPILFVGEKPNPKRNLSMEVPFVGTSSYRTLLEWVYRLDIDFQLIRALDAYNVHGEALPLDPVSLKGMKVITLGEAAKAFIEKLQLGCVFPIQRFALPLPVPGKNADPRRLQDLLSRCRRFIYST